MPDIGGILILTLGGSLLDFAECDETSLSFRESESKRLIEKCELFGSEAGYETSVSVSLFVSIRDIVMAGFFITTAGLAYSVSVILFASNRPIVTPHADLFGGASGSETSVSVTRSVSKGSVLPLVFVVSKARDVKAPVEKSVRAGLVAFTLPFLMPSFYFSLNLFGSESFLL